MNSWEAIPPDLADLCTEVAERVCDAIEHRKAIGHDFMRATGHMAERGDRLYERIRKLRARVHGDEVFSEAEPSFYTSLSRLTERVGNQLETAPKAEAGHA